MTRRRLLSLGIAALLLGLVVNLPAVWLARQVQERIPAMRLAGVDGTVLAGQAQYAVADGIVLEGVEWRLRPVALLAGRLAADLTVTTDNGRIGATASYGLSGGGSRLSDAEGAASLAWFGGLAGYPQLPISGDLRLVLDEAEIGDDFAVSRIAGRVRLADARWELAKPSIVLGGFDGILTTEDDTLTLRLAESDGPLVVQGTVQLIGGDQYRLDLRLRPRAGADERLESTLKLLGRPDAEGAYQIRERGRF
jgi:hypothetical protein